MAEPKVRGPYKAKTGTRGSKPGEHRGGRKKGTPNKNTSAIRDMIVNALDKAGGVDYLYRQATEQPVAFMGLVGKVMPTQMVGLDDGPVLAIIERRIVK